MKKRNRIDIIHDILSTISEQDGKIKPTHILYKSNLSHKLMEAYLNELIEKKLITEKTAKKSKTYSVTDKGYEFIGKYKGFVDFIDAFGLYD